jgi:hypothetical protein
VGPAQNPIQWAQGFFSEGFMLTGYLHLALSLGMSGAVPLPFVYVFMAWTGTTFPLNTIEWLVAKKYQYRLAFLAAWAKQCGQWQRTTWHRPRFSVVCAWDRTWDPPPLHTHTHTHTQNVAWTLNIKKVTSDFVTPFEGGDSISCLRIWETEVIGRQLGVSFSAGNRPVEPDSDWNS